MNIPTFEHIKIARNLCGITVTLNRPQVRNAINGAMLNELFGVCTWISTQQDIRALVLQGADGHFCAGGDIADMLAAAQAYESGDQSAFYELNLAYGKLLLTMARLPCTTISLLEGSVMGGGLGLAAVSDICLASETALLAMPEATLGLPPAQIAAFVAARIGNAKARQLALTAKKLTAQEALDTGLVDQLVQDQVHLLQALATQLRAINHCSPAALKTTKSLLIQQSPFSEANDANCEQMLARAAQAFSDAVTQGDGPEGTQAFMQKRRPKWIRDEEVKA